MLLASAAAPAGMVRITLLPLKSGFGVSTTVQTVPLVTSVKSDTVPRTTARSVSAKPVTAAENVIVTVTGPAALSTPPRSVSIVTAVSPVTTMSKVSEAVPPLPSLVVTFTDSVPTSAAAGVPEKVRVAASKLSQSGKAAASACVAV